MEENTITNSFRRLLGYVYLYSKSMDRKVTVEMSKELFDEFKKDLKKELTDSGLVLNEEEGNKDLSINEESKFTYASGHFHAMVIDNKDYIFRITAK